MIPALSTVDDAASGTKICPACAEHIKAAAIVCRHCGYDFAAGISRGAQTKTNGLAIASMVLGILWVYWVGSILALVFGYVARRQIRDSGGRESGHGMAVAGIVLGWVGIGSLCVVLVIALGAALSM